MNKFEWIPNQYLKDEKLVCKQDGVSIQDGSLKSGFNNGFLELSTERLIWYDPKDINYRIGMMLQMIKSIHLQKGGLGKPNSIQITSNINFYDKDLDHNHAFQSPVSNSSNDNVTFIFKKSGEAGFYDNLNETLNAKPWLPQKLERSKGILGIERTLENKSRATDKNIEVAFSDLNRLMNQAQVMVGLCQKISQKISEKEEFSSDETVQFKSYLLSMGIADPVTRRNCSNSETYFEKLAVQLSSFLKDILPKTGGLLSSTDVFCRINRARGMELLSPEDLIEAGRLMEKLKLPVIMKIFNSGVMVFQLSSMADETTVTETVDIVVANESITAEKLSRIILIPPILSKERLLLCESHGRLCRDDTVEGLRFFPNRLLTET